jgi:hypothetical protein
MRGTQQGEPEVQQERSRGEGDYRARHREMRRAGKRGLVLASIVSAAAGRRGREGAESQSARGRHEGGRVRRPGFRRRGSHGVTV